MQGHGEARTRAPGGAASRWVEGVVQDLRFASRLLVRSPGLVAAAVACLAIGIGITTAIYGVMGSLVFRKLPAVSRPAELVRLQALMPYGNWEELRGAGGPFADVAAYRAPVPFVLTPAEGRAERIWGQVVTPNYFTMLGVRAAAGRVFGREEERDGTGQAAVISHRMWQTRFGSDRALVGRTIRVNGQAVTVIGVAAPGFLGASPMLSTADLWIPTTAPAAVAPELAGMRTRRAPEFDLVGRLKPGMTTERAEARLETTVRRLEQVHNDPNRDRKERRAVLVPGGRLYPIRDEDMPKAMGLPLVLVGLVLLMACGNVANMLIARGAARQKEIAVRIATGAGRGRIVRQLLTESVLLAVGGGVAGLLLAVWVAERYRAMGTMFPAFTDFTVELDWRAMLFAVGLTAFCGLVFGLAPALEATRQSVALGLKPESGVPLRALRWFSLRNVLVANQVAASVVLLMITGFIVVGFGSSANGDLGFDYRNLYLFSVDPVRDGYDAERAAAYFDKLQERLELVPGVTSVSVAETLPVAMTGTESVISAKVELFGGSRSAGTIHSDRVGAWFFDTMRMDLLRGRGFRRHDISDSARVVVVNETMARESWPGRDALGQTIEIEDRTYDVVGVAPDVRSPLPLGAPQPGVYLPMTPSRMGVASPRGTTVVVRVRPGFDAVERLREEFRAYDANVTVFQARRMEDVVGQAFFLVRVATSVYGTLGVFALALALVGLSGVTSYTVARRTREVGIRVALGARKGDILRLVMRDSVAIVTVGAAAGTALALAAMRVLSFVLNAMAEATRFSASDARLIVGAPVLLTALALVACYLPARRSARSDPASVLRSE